MGKNLLISSLLPPFSPLCHDVFTLFAASTIVVIFQHHKKKVNNVRATTAVARFR